MTSSLTEHAVSVPSLPPVGPLVAELRQRFASRITAVRELPARSAHWVDLPPGLDPRLASALEQRGIGRLYSHQSEAWEAVRQGRHTVIVTPTASGKTLCYNLPVLQDILQRRGKALYLFPTKALAQDQLAELAEFNRLGELGVRACTFDGDTSGDARKAVRLHGDIVLSNPDMLHQGILPHHTKWSQLFEDLTHVVVDEMHTYRGVFGSHVANLFRRLRRICRFHGSDPVFVLASATIANPAELGAQLVGAPVHLVQRNGAPQGARTLLLWNPPMVNQELAIRASARSQTTRIARLAVQRGLKSILFARSRLMVEVLTKYLKDRFDRDPRHPPRVRAYRGGYLPTQRRVIERSLRDDEVDCVVSTSALELGVDIGSLDVCVLNGYPGTIAGARQRLGRAGRRQRASLGVLVAGSSPLDQYVVRHPEFFLDGSPEHARVDPDHLLILLEQLRCAAFELPFLDQDRFGDVPVREFLDYLREEGVLHREEGRWHWVADSYPANSVSLRSVSEGNFTVIDQTDGGQEVIAEVDFFSTPSTLYEGAIYMIQSRPWQVERLDWEGRKAFVRETRADYYTDAIDYTRLKILECFNQEDAGQGCCSQGEVHLVVRMAGYKKIRYYSHENIGYGPIHLPDQAMHTQALWWRLDPVAMATAFPERWCAMEGFLGAAHALHFSCALLSMCEVGDLGRAVGDASGEGFARVSRADREDLLELAPAAGDEEGRDGLIFRPTLFLYDNRPGGMGLAPRLFEQRDELPRRAWELVRGCGCAVGCPACIGATAGGRSREAEGDAKQRALTVLALLGGVA